MKIIRKQVFPVAFSHFLTTTASPKNSKKFLTYFQNIFTLRKKWYPHPESEYKSKESVIYGHKIFDIQLLIILNHLGGFFPPGFNKYLGISSGFHDVSKETK